MHETLARILGGQNSSPSDVLHRVWEEIPDNVEWGEGSPIATLDQCERLIEMYCEQVIPKLSPKYVEQWFEKPISEPPFDKLVVCPDLILANGTVIDFKVRSSKVSQAEADCSLQPTITAAVLGVKELHFEYHSLIPAKEARYGITRTTRTKKEISHCEKEIIPAVASSVRSSKRSKLFVSNPTAYHSGCPVSGCPYS